jgi:hypothetical protein
MLTEIGVQNLQSTELSDQNVVYDKNLKKRLVFGFGLLASSAAPAGLFIMIKHMFYLHCCQLDFIDFQFILYYFVVLRYLDLS